MKERNNDVQPAELLLEAEEELPLLEATPMRKNTLQVSRGDGDELIETSLSQTIESEHNIKHVAKELFSRKDIDLKSEVSYNEVNNLTRLQFLEDALNIGHIRTLKGSLLALRVSLKRKSRGELIQMAQTENRNQQAGFNLAKLWGGGNNQNP